MFLNYFFSFAQHIHQLSGDDVTPGTFKLENLKSELLFIWKAIY